MATAAVKGEEKMEEVMPGVVKMEDIVSPSNAMSSFFEAADDEEMDGSECEEDTIHSQIDHKVSA